MARFFLHLHECGTVTKDDEGSELPDFYAAHDRAVAAARAIICHEALEGEICMNCYIAIEDADHVEVDRIRFSDAVKVTGAG